MTQIARPSETADRTRAALIGRAPGLTAREKIGLAVLAAERARRDAFARMRRSRLLRWRYRSGESYELLLAPPDLRAHDPSFAEELGAGTLGLAGAVAEIGSRSPFAVAPPCPEWARELHGFGWLRHLDVGAASEHASMARRLAHDWIVGSRRRHTYAWAPEVVGRRLISWLAHAGVLLDGADRRAYGAIMRSLGDQITYLSASWRNAPDGYPRLLALIGLVEADLCLAGQERRIAMAEKQLAQELERQILPDGGHISRNPWVITELLLDLLPLRQCFAARNSKPDPAFTDAIARMTPMLRRLRLGDGQIARFNGMGATERDTLATVLAYGETKLAPSASAPPSGYVRLERGSTVLVVDAGPPPPLELAGAACAGCLSFEISTGSEALFVNGGTPGWPDARSRAAARATASHNTLSLGDQSSSKLIRNARLERQIGAAPIRHPDRVTLEVRDEAGAPASLQASHDGYGATFGLVHKRRLVLDPSGGWLEGVDTLSAVRGVMRFAWDLPFAIHFHLHSDTEAELADSVEAAELILASGARWRLAATGAALSIEESTHFAGLAGPRPAQQVVLRGVCHGASEVAWTLERLEAGRPRGLRKLASLSLRDPGA